MGTVCALAIVVYLALWLGRRRLAYRLGRRDLPATALDAPIWALVGVPHPDSPRIIVY